MPGRIVTTLVPCRRVSNPKASDKPCRAYLDAQYSPASTAGLQLGCYQYRLWKISIPFAFLDPTGKRSGRYICLGDEN